MNAAKRLKALWPALEHGDAGAIHEVRKLSRRVGAVLEAHDAPRRQRHGWRDLRRAVADVRDWDAVGVHLRASLIALGASAQVLARFDSAWAAGREGRWAQVRLPAQPDPDLPGGGEHLRRHLRDRWADLCGSAPAVLAGGDELAWHALRKHVKALRYLWEQQAEVPALLTLLLDALGRVQDAHVARAALRDPAVPRAFRSRLAAREQAAQTAARDEARRLWPLVAQLDVPS